MILDEKKLINECLSRSWTQMVLQTKSGVSLTTISKAYNGKPISDKSAKKDSRCISYQFRFID